MQPQRIGVLAPLKMDVGEIVGGARKAVPVEGVAPAPFLHDAPGDLQRGGLRRFAAAEKRIDEEVADPSPLGKRPLVALESGDQLAAGSLGTGVVSRGQGGFDPAARAFYFGPFEVEPERGMPHQEEDAGGHAGVADRENPAT